MNLTKARVETTARNAQGERIFRHVTVEYDASRAVEENFIEASERTPAQHRIFVRDTTNRFERQIGVTLRPELITRFLAAGDCYACDYSLRSHQHTSVAVQA